MTTKVFGNIPFRFRSLIPWMNPTELELLEAVEKFSNDEQGYLDFIEFCMVTTLTQVRQTQLPHTAGLYPVFEYIAALGVMKFRNPEIRNHFQPDENDNPRLLPLITSTYEMRGDAYEESYTAWLNACVSNGDMIGIFENAIKLIDLYTTTGKFEKATDYFHKIVHVVNLLVANHEYTEEFLQVGIDFDVIFDTYQPLKAMDYRLLLIIKEIERKQAIEVIVLFSRVLLTYAKSLQAMGKMSASALLLNTGITIAIYFLDYYSIVQGFLLQGTAEFWQYRNEVALEHFITAQELAKMSGDMDGQVQSLLNQSRMYVAMGMFDAAEQIQTELLHIANKLQETSLQIISHLFMSKLHYKLLQIPKCQLQLKSALSIAKNFDLHLQLIQLYQFGVELAVDLGDQEATAEYMHSLSLLVERAQDTLEESKYTLVYYHQAEALQAFAKGKYTKAIGNWHQVIEHSQQLHLPMQLLIAHFKLAEIYFFRLKVDNTEEYNQAFLHHFNLSKALVDETNNYALFIDLLYLKFEFFSLSSKVYLLNNTVAELHNKFIHWELPDLVYRLKPYYQWLTQEQQHTYRSSILMESIGYTRRIPTIEFISIATMEGKILFTHSYLNKSTEVETLLSSFMKLSNEVELNLSDLFKPKQELLHSIDNERTIVVERNTRLAFMVVAGAESYYLRIQLQELLASLDSYIPEDLQNFNTKQHKSKIALLCNQKLLDFLP